jgi:hypothetical protein
MIRQSSLIDVQEEAAVAAVQHDAASCSFVAQLEELSTLTDFVTCVDAEAPLRVLQPPFNLEQPTATTTPAMPNNEVLMALEELHMCGDFFLCQDPELSISSMLKGIGEHPHDESVEHIAPRTPKSRSPTREQKHLPDPPAANDLFGNIYTIESPSGISYSNVVRNATTCGGTYSYKGRVVQPSTPVVNETIDDEQDDYVVYKTDTNYVLQAQSSALAASKALREENEPLIMIVDEDDSRTSSSTRAVRDDSSSISYYRRSPMHLSYALSPPTTTVRGGAGAGGGGRVVAMQTVTTNVAKRQQPAEPFDNNEMSTNNSGDSSSNNNYGGDVTDTDTVRAVAPRKNFHCDESIRSLSLSSTNKVVVVVVRRSQFTTSNAE